MKKLLSLVIVLVLAVSMFTGCGDKKTESGDNGSTSDAKEETTDKNDSKDESEAAQNTDDSTGDAIKLGMLSPTSGDLAVYGVAVKNAAEMAIKEVNEAGGINGKDVELIVYDNEGDPTKSINLFNRLVEEDHIVALIGPVISGTSIVIGPLADEAGIPMLTPTATNIDVTIDLPYVFRACYIDPYQGRIVAKFANENLEAKSAVVFRNVSNDYSIGLADAFTGAFSGEILADEGYTQEDNDFKAIISKISKLNPDVIFIPDYFNVVGLIAKQLNEAGVEATLLGGDGWDGIQASYAEEVEGDYFANHYSTTDESEIVQNFITSYKDNYDEVPNALAALSYDGTKVMVAAIENAGSTDGAAIKDAIAAIDMDAVCGHITFDENGDTIKAISIITVKDGDLQLETKISE